MRGIILDDIASVTLRKATDPVIMAFQKRLRQRQAEKLEQMFHERQQSLTSLDDRGPSEVYQLFTIPL